MQPVTVTQVPVQRFSYVPKFQPPTFQKPAHLFPGRQLQSSQAIEFDGKRLRKAVTRKTVDYNSAIVKYLEARVWQRDYRDRRVLQPDSAYYTELLPPLSMLDNPINAVTTKFVRTSTNKMRCPIFCVAWTPEGRRLVTGASSGEFTLWNGLTFNFETILQAHDSPVRCMVWSHNDTWMVTGDHAGYVKYWQSNMNNVKMFQAHKEALRGISFCPLDTKFATCSDDGTVRIWDFLKCFEEKILRGHGADVKCVDWHPTKALLVSGSKDSQQPIKLWDPKSGQSLATIHAHKNTVMDTKWNKNGNWLLTASRDHLIKLFDIRNMKEELQTFRGHKKEATTLSWHPVHEGLFSSGGSDGSIMFWVVGADKEVGSMEQAHDSCVWSLAWHPLGHILCSGSNDHMSKFWTRNRPGDRMRDKYNLNTLPKGQEDGAEYDDSGTLSAIPGMGLEHGLPEHLKPQEQHHDLDSLAIPGLDLTSDDTVAEKTAVTKKMPFSKPIPKQFQQQWMESKQPLLLGPPMDSAGLNAVNEDSGNNEAPPVSQGQMPPPNIPPDQNQYMYQGNRLPNSHLPPPPPNSMQFPRMEPPPALQPSILGNRPRAPHQMGPPPPPPHMGRDDFNMTKQNPHFAENYPHPPIDGIQGEYDNDWRTYKEESEDVSTGNGYGPDSRPEHFQKRSFRENTFPNEHMPSGPPPYEDKDLRFMNEDMDQRLDMGYGNNSHHSWQDSSSKDSRYPLDNRAPDFRGPPPLDGRSSDFRGPPPDSRPPKFRGPPPDSRPPEFRGPPPDGHPSEFRGPPPPDNRPPEFRGSQDSCPPEFRGPPDSCPPDFRGPPDSHSSDFRGPPPDGRPPEFRGPPTQDSECRGLPPPEFLRPQLRPRGGPMFFSGRGQRGSFRGHSPYRVVNQRGRGGRGGFND